MIRTRILVSACALAFLLAPVTASAQSTSEIYAEAVGDTARPATDTARDAARHPAEILAFSGLKRGDRVADFIMGGGYFTRLFSDVVGSEGKVYAYQPSEFVAFSADYARQQDAVAQAYSNVTASRESLGVWAAPEPLDVIFTAQNFHDLYLRQVPAGSPQRIAEAWFAGLKPGGTLIVIDHQATVGQDPIESGNGQHRIDRAAVVQVLTRAGFVLDGESDLLKNAADPHTANVFNPAIRGHTDQFILRFRKPA